MKNKIENGTHPVRLAPLIYEILICARFLKTRFFLFVNFCMSYVIIEAATSKYIKELSTFETLLLKPTLLTGHSVLQIIFIYIYI